jgi:putative FmdB family regulatory protein
MATYDYECTACGRAFETTHSMAAAALRKCPKCGKLKLRRLISGGAGVIFKGAGFYETDYRRNRRGGDFAEKTKEEAGTSTSSDTSKPATKPEQKAQGKPGTKPAAKAEDGPMKDTGSKKD